VDEGRTEVDASMATPSARANKCALTVSNSHQLPLRIASAHNIRPPPATAAQYLTAVTSTSQAIPRRRSQASRSHSTYSTPRGRRPALEILQ